MRRPTALMSRAPTMRRGSRRRLQCHWIRDYVAPLANEILVVRKMVESFRLVMESSRDANPHHPRLRSSNLMCRSTRPFYRPRPSNFARTITDDWGHHQLDMSGRLGTRRGQSHQERLRPSGSGRGIRLIGHIRNYISKWDSSLISGSGRRVRRRSSSSVPCGGDDDVV